VALGVAGNGEMDVPSDADTVAWYEYGPSPGQEGSAVLAAHVDYNGRKGVFFDLSDLPADATLTVEFDGAPSRTFTVVKDASIAKEALPVDELFRRDGRPELTLITCGGEFDAATRSYRKNIVVHTVPTSD
jgi:sortase (surface protein transpeptidase)